MNPRLLAHRTRTQVAATPPDVVVVPVGALEQHGPHLMVGTDTMHAEAVALRAAEAATDVDVVVAPAVAYGCSDHHIPFGATLSLSSATLLAVLRDVVRSAAASGFRRVFFLNGHGGNHELIQVAARDAAQEFGIAVGAGSWWAMARDALIEAGGADGTRLPGHAGGFETSVIGAILDERITDLPGPSSSFGPTDPRNPEAAFRTERPEGWSDTEGYTDDPGALDIDTGRRLLEVAGRAIGDDLTRFVAQTPITTEEH
ncbi:MAG: creatininase family protein [Ilumatobacteraceae bacterium]|nr:creatininase family protein [Ilumatobacteraceae bacterium]